MEQNGKELFCPLLYYCFLLFFYPQLFTNVYIFFQILGVPLHLFSSRGLRLKYGGGLVVRSKIEFHLVFYLEDFDFTVYFCL